MPAADDLANRGPIPAGTYIAGPPISSPTHGPYAIPLIPDQSNIMYMRSGFMMHGDSIEAPGTASEGCIIMPRFARERFVESGQQLQVVSGLDEVESGRDSDMGMQ